ncbi:MAG: hypothetical protein ACF787_11655 [Rhodopirellula sp. JB053]
MYRSHFIVSLLATASLLSSVYADSPKQTMGSAEHSGAHRLIVVDDSDELRLMLMDDDPVVDEPLRLPADDDSDLSPSSDSSESLPEPKESEQQDRIEQEKRDKARERLASRLAELRKSPRNLRINKIVASQEGVPVNQAAEIMSEEPQWIAAGNFTTPRAVRVHARFCHQPTYYQEMNLERCGRLDCESCGCLQDLYSRFWFVTNTAILPYRFASQPHCRCVDSYGDCPTCRRYNCSIEPLRCGEDCCQTGRGLLTESAAIAGFAFLLL